MVIWTKALWKVHVVDLGKLLRTWRVVEKLISNLTRQKNFYSKSDDTKKFLFKIMLFTKTFSFKITIFRKNIFFEIVLFKSARKTQNLHILRGKLKQNVIFCVFSKSCFLKIIFSSKSCFLKIIFSTKSCFLKIYFSAKSYFFKNYSSSKSDAS